MIFYMSGGEIEKTLKRLGVKSISMMMSFYTNKNKPDKRFKRIVNWRKRKLRKDKNENKS